MDILEQQILDYVARPNYQPVKPKVITRRLGLTRDHEAQVRRTVKKMVRGGLLTWGAKHHVLPVREKREQQNSRPKDAGRQDGKRRDSKRRSNSQVVGIFTRHPRGFGFVRSEGSPPPENGEQNDIFIPISYTGDACHGDTVLVEIKKSQEGQQRFPKHKRRNRNDGGKPPRIEGRIVEVQQRATHQFVGTFHLFDRHPFVIIDKNIFAERIPLGRGDTSQIRPGEKIVVEMVRFPSPAVEDLGAAVVVQVLGKASAPGVDTQMIIAEYDLPGEFDEAAIQDAREQAERFANENFEESQRRDLRGLTILAIDPEDARDHDDAVSVELTDDGYKLGVHIADVSYFVRSKSDLDRVARERGTSVYLPDCVIPMLPEIVSNSLASLQPNTPRLAKTVFMTFTREGVMTDVEIMHSLIESQAQFSYKEVDEFYTTGQADWPEEICNLLCRMRDLSKILRACRTRDGGFDLSLPDVKLVLDAKGRAQDAVSVQQTPSQAVIEDFMLAANEAVASWLTEQEVPFLSRVHEAPSSRKLQELTRFVDFLGFHVENLQDRFELQKLLGLASQTPKKYTVHLATLRSMQQAYYAPSEAGHYALAKKCYTHFTSPIRRYPDLLIHRLIDTLLAGKKPTQTVDDLHAQGEQCSNLERRAETAERELIKLKVLQLMSQKVGKTMEAVITGVKKYGFFVQGTTFPAEGLIAIETLTDEKYYFEREMHQFVGYNTGKTYAIGDVLQVRVERVDVNQRIIDFSVAENR